MPWPRLSRIAWPAAAASLTLGFLLTADWILGPYDEGIVLTGAMRLLHGAVPHRDFYANYGPGQFAALASLFAAMGPAAWLERLWDALTRTAIVLLVFAIARPLAGRWPAGLAALAALAWLAGLTFTYGYPLFPAVAAGLAGLAVLPAAIRGDRRRAAAAGVCFGVATLFRYDVGVGMLAAVAVGLLPAARAILPVLLAGFAVVAVPLFAVLELLGALPGLWFDVVAFPARAYAATRALPAPGLAAIRQYPIAASVFLPPLACAAALPALVQRWRRGDRPAVTTLLCLLLVALVLYAKGWVRLSPLHISGGYLAALPLLAAAWRTRAARPAIAAVAAGFAFCTIFPAHGILRRLRTNLRTLPAACAAPPPLACMTVDQPAQAAFAYVDAHTAGTDPIFVGLPAHDRIYANDVAFYFAADRPPATHWYHFDPGLQTSLPIQRSMLRDLEVRHPPLVVRADVFGNIREPNESARSSGIRALDDYIAAHYAQVARFGRYTILQRIATAPVTP